MNSRRAPLDRELKQLQQRRQELVDQLYELLNELGETPARKRPVGLSPIRMLESGVNELVLMLERFVGAAVSAAIDRIERGRRGR